jgi:hypothetical protein
MNAAKARPPVSRKLRRVVSEMERDHRYPETAAFLKRVAEEEKTKGR